MSRFTPPPMRSTRDFGGADDTPLAPIADQPGSFWVKITGQAAGTNRYAWTQIDDGDTAAFDTGLSDDFAATGTSAADGAPAYEINGRTDVPTGSRVRVWPAGDLTFYAFSLAGGVPGGSSSVGDVIGPDTAQTGQLVFFTDPSGRFVGPGVIASGVVVMSSFYDLTSATFGAWYDVGAELSLPTAGTYLITGHVTAGMYISASGVKPNGIQARLLDVFTGASIAGTLVTVVTQNDLTDGEVGTTGFSLLFTAVTPRAIKLQASVAMTSGGVVTSAFVGTFSQGTTQMNYVRLS